MAGVPATRRLQSLQGLPPCTGRKNDLYTETTGECVMIEGTPVQFLPTSPGLLDEAMQHAVQIDYDGVPTWVLGAEYLLAIAVSTGRAKDRMRVPLFLESGKIDLACLTDILERHALFERWETWAQQ